MTSADLKTIYFRALDACAPERLVARTITPDMPRTVVALGKCAGALLDGVPAVDEAFVAIPEGYREPTRPAKIHKGGHPQITGASFEVGHALIDFVEARENILFLISGGGSACVDVPLEPWFDERDLVEVNARLIASGVPIGEINCVRKHLSAIKGGRLAARVSGKSLTLVYSDVSSGALGDVASGPTLPDPTTKGDAIAILERLGGFDRIVTKLRDDSCPETVKQIDRSRVELIADNDTLTAAAASIAESMNVRAIRCEQQIECDVREAVSILLQHVNTIRAGELLIAGGEPLVVIRGNGKGGRCSELAVRMALASTAPLTALFGSSDGVDGNSGVGGVLVFLPAALDRGAAEKELAQSNSLEVARSIGEPLTMLPTGNNLRDLYLLARS